MRKLFLLVASAFCAHASTFTIVSGIASSGFGVSGVGGYESDVVVLYSLEQYDQADVGLPDLKQDVYFRYSYVFAAAQDDHRSFDRLIVGLSKSCDSDPECVFGLQTDGISARVGQIRTYAQGDATPTPGLADPLHGILLDAFSPSASILGVSFFSNRIPDPKGRIYLQGGEDYLLTDPGSVITPDQRVLPQTEPPVSTPEPLTISLFASGLAAILLMGPSNQR